MTFCIQEMKECFNGKFQQVKLAVKGSLELVLALVANLVTNLFIKLPFSQSS